MVRVGNEEVDPPVQLPEVQLPASSTGLMTTRKVTPCIDPTFVIDSVLSLPLTTDRVVAESRGISLTTSLAATPCW